MLTKQLYIYLKPNHNFNFHGFLEIVPVDSSCQPEDVPRHRRHDRLHRGHDRGLSRNLLKLFQVNRFFQFDLDIELH